MIEQHQLRTVEVNGTQLAYTERGSGDPVVYVHGGESDVTIWEPILESVGRHHRAIAYSRRWAWPNEPIPDGEGDIVDRHAADLIGLIETLQLRKVDLVGNSWGAFICLVVARDRPDLIRRLVLQEPPAVTLFMGAPPGPSGLLKTLVTNPRVGVPLARMVFTGLAPTEALVKKGRVEESVDRFVRKVALGDDGYEQLPNWVKEHMQLDQNLRTHASQFRNNGGFVPFTKADARSIRAPALVMKGESSPDHLTVIADELARLLPNGQTVTIPGASHVMHVANPEATADAIASFLSAP